MASSTPDLFEVITEIVRWQLGELNTAIPARVLRYDPDRQEADVQPLIKRRYRDGTAESRAPITGVPVLFPAAGGGIIHFPVEIGDTVLLIFCQRSIDRWVNSDGGEVDPLDNRQHSLSDAVAIPGLFPFPNALKGERNSVIIKYSGAEFKLAEGGAVSLKAPGGFTVEGDTTVTGTVNASVDVVAATVSLKAHLHSGVTPGVGVSGPPVP